MKKGKYKQTKYERIDPGLSFTKTSTDETEQECHEWEYLQHIGGFDGISVRAWILD
jgi:hypothetical protein